MAHEETLRFFNTWIRNLLVAFVLMSLLIAVFPRYYQAIILSDVVALVIALFLYLVKPQYEEPVVGHPEALAK